MPTNLPDGGAAVWCEATRISDLDPNGFVAPGASTYTSAALIKATLTPVLATGDDIEVKNANGDLAVFGKHGDIPKYATISIEFATPDPVLEQLLCGGVLLSDTSAVLGTPTGLVATPQATLGSLAAGPQSYRATFFNQYGESTPQASVVATTTGSTGAVVLSGITQPAGAMGVRIYGRVQGSEQLIGSINNIGSQATSAASGTGAVAALTVTALTKSIPIGTQFQITGDTNTTKIVFTATATVPPGAVTIPVSPSQSVTITIAAAALVPVFVDTGVITPNGALPSVDTTMGGGPYTGYQAPALGTVANPDGVSIEFFEKAIVQGYQAPQNPYWRIVLPRCSGFHVMPRTVQNQNLENVYEGQGFQNPNWGSGPLGDWQFDSTKWMQRARCAKQIVPVPSLQPLPALV